MFVRDEKIVYYLSFIAEPAHIYTNYLMRVLPSVEKARCQLAAQFEDNLLEHYSFFYASAPVRSTTMLCARVLNIKKEVYRHQL